MFFCKDNEIATMNESKLAGLFQAYFAKTATPEEQDELMELLIRSENDAQIKILLTETWQKFHSHSKVFTDALSDEMLVHILQKAASDKKVPVIGLFSRSFRWLRLPAAAAILFLAVMGGYLWLQPRQVAQQTAQSKIIVKDAIVPGGNKALLTLSDGSIIVLDSTSQGTLAKQGNVKIVKLHTATLTYKAGDKNSQEVVYNTLSTPKGGQYQLILPDSTLVWLNASSSIHFPTLFKGKERNVTITGEAYFEVAKNAAMPFTINVRDAKVQVLGTHFNIMAYNDENSMNTTLLEGSVKISKGALQQILIPGQQSTINKTGESKILEADLDEVMAWKNGWFQFNASSIEKIMRQISRWYDVGIEYEGKIPTGHFSGLVSRQNDISQVLKIMEAGGVRYKIEGRKVIILS